MSKWQFAAIIFAALIIQALIGGAPLFQSEEPLPPGGSHRKYDSQRGLAAQEFTTAATSQRRPNHSIETSELGNYPQISNQNQNQAPKFNLTENQNQNSNQAADCTHDAQTFRCVQYLRNYDGDTVTVRIPNVHPLIGENISVRIVGIDTPEMNGKRPCEKERARDAQRLVENLLKNAKNIELKNVDRDKYFRILAEILADRQSIADILIKNKLAYPYDGGRKPASIDWCNYR